MRRPPPPGDHAPATPEDGTGADAPEEAGDAGDDGSDLMAGGAGADTFVVDFTGTSGEDVIIDFDPVEDKLVLDADTDGWDGVSVVFEDVDAVTTVVDRTHPCVTRERLPIRPERPTLTLSEDVTRDALQ